MQRPLPAPSHCTDCGPVSRREFMRTTATAAALVGATSSGLIVPGVARAAEAASSETLVAQLYGSLTEAQRKGLCFPFDHELRLKVDNNWQITPKSIGGQVLAFVLMQPYATAAALALAVGLAGRRGGPRAPAAG